MQEFSIKDFVKYIAKTWRMSALFVLIGLIAGAAYNYVQVPLYETTSKIVVTAPSTGGSRESTLGNYVELLRSQSVLGDASEAINIEGVDTSTLQKSLTVRNEKSTDVISIEYTTTDSNSGEYVVHETIQSFKNAMYDLYGVKDENINIINQPRTSGTPYNVQTLKTIVIGFGAGVAVAFVVAFIRFDISSGEERNDKVTSGKTAKLTPEQKRLQKLEFDRKKAEIEAKISEEKARKAQADSDAAEAQNSIIKFEIDAARKEVEIAKAKKEAAELLAEEIAKKVESEDERIRGEIEAERLKAEKDDLARQTSVARNKAELDVRKINAEMKAKHREDKQQIKRDIMDARIENRLMAAESRSAAKARRAEIKARSKAKVASYKNGANDSLGADDTAAKERIMTESQIRIARIEANIEEKTREKIARKQAKLRVQAAGAPQNTARPSDNKPAAVRTAPVAKATVSRSLAPFSIGKPMIKTKRRKFPFFFAGTSNRALERQRVSELRSMNTRLIRQHDPNRTNGQ